MGRLIGRGVIRPELQKEVTDALSKGIISMEGHEHKVQRKLIGPAFTAQSMKELASIFYSKADELCDFWDSERQTCQDSEKRADREGFTVDVTAGLGRAIFDAMGLGGFDYDFNSLRDPARPDHQPYRKMFRVVDQGISPRDIVDLYLPFLRKFLVSALAEITRDRPNSNNTQPSEKTVTIRECSKDIDKLGKTIIKHKRNNLQSDEDDAKDILSLLVKANLSSDPSARLSDKELLDQCSTFLFAGTDSVAIGLTWALQQLATHPEIQTQLFQEINASQQAKGIDGYSSDNSDDSGFVEGPSMRGTHMHTTWAKSLDTLPFLDRVVRETLRLSPPVHSTIRVATKDDEIVLSEPVSIDGKLSTSFRIRKGTYIHIPIEGINYAEDIWGSDAREFK